MPDKKIVGNTTATPFVPGNTPNLEELKNELESLFATKEELENLGGGGDNSPKGAIKFSNGIQLRVNEEEHTIEFYNSNTGEAKTLFIVGEESGVICADEALWAFFDSSGNTFEEHYATKEEVGNIETALDAIIALQNSYSGVSE